MLEWGLKKNMIRPQDPKEIGNAEFSYSFYMPQNYDMTTLAIPEKIQEPVDQMIAVCLRMQQLIAKMRPPAYRDWETDRKSTRLNSSHSAKSRMPSSA